MIFLLYLRGSWSTILNLWSISSPLMSAADGVTSSGQNCNLLDQKTFGINQSPPSEIFTFY